MEAEHNIIFAQCLDGIFKKLPRDIFNIKLSGLPAKDICKPSPDPLAAVEYACVYWMDHLQRSERDRSPEISMYKKGHLDIFLQKNFFHWLETLSILGSVSDGIQAMQRLETLIEVSCYLCKGMLFSSNNGLTLAG